MRKFLTVQGTKPSPDSALLLARVGIAVLMLIHGIPKLQMLFSGTPVQFPGIMGISPEISLALAVFAEVFCSMLILVGFATRFATIPLIITMLIAVFVIHGSDPFSKQEPALYFLLVYLVLFLAGSGKYSIDFLLQSSDKKAKPVFEKEIETVLRIYQ